MKKLLLVIIVLLSGCFITDTGRRESFTRENPDTPTSIQKDILAGDISIGMTKRQVIASWGYPNNSSFTITKAQRTLSTFYYTRTFVYFTNNKVSALHRY